MVQDASRLREAGKGESMKRQPTPADVLAEAHSLIVHMDRVRPDVPAERLAAFERRYAQAVALRDIATTEAVFTGLNRRLRALGVE